MSPFLDTVDNEIRKALPTNWKLISNDRLLGKDPYKIRSAFISSQIDGRPKLINILALEASLQMSKQIEIELVKLRDYILSKNCLLIVVCEEIDSDNCGDVSLFESEVMKICHPNYLSLYCSSDNEFKTTINGDNFEHLNSIIRDLWLGKLIFTGPILGTQYVNLEIVKDDCWKCRKSIRTVTGIVFPDIQMASWNNNQWRYFNQLISLASISSEQALLIKNYVEILRCTDRMITPVSYRYSGTTKSKYWAASCPYCDSLRGNFFITDHRLQFLHDLESRVNMDLHYHSIKLTIDHKLIVALNNGFESCPHTTLMGWERK